METIRAAMTRRLLGETSGPLMGIYLITHRASGKRYVGQSIDIARRWREHWGGRGDSPMLTNALKKHGPDAFAFEIVELCAREELNDRECFYIFAFDCMKPLGYNIGAGGEGVNFTPEVRAKLREAMHRLAADPEWRAKQGARLSRANADPTIYTIINVKTGERDTGTRLDFRERYGMRREMLADLVNGKRKAHRGWKLASVGAQFPALRP